MPQKAHDYFRYLPSSPASEPWGLTVTAAGFTEIRPGTPYPPARHPDDHDLNWERGRRLAAFQIVSIQAGRGWFESEPTGLKRIAAGSAFAVMPGVWHRYRPDPATGWTESWVEMKGALIEKLIVGRVLRKAEPLRRRVATTQLDEALNALHVRVRRSTGRFDPQISVGAFAILAAWTGPGQEPRAESATTAKIIEAEQYLAAHHHEAIDLKAFAKQRGIAYSHFRKLFRAHTGYAPWAYVLRLRLVRARRMLLQSSATLEEIASELGFSSAFHFSAAFKQAFGLAPSVWRKRQ